MIKSIWTSENDDRLRELVAKGASANRIAAALNRRVHSVRDRARRLGCSIPTVAAQRRAMSVRQSEDR